MAGTLLPARDFLRNVAEYGKLEAVPLRQEGIQGILSKHGQGSVSFCSMVIPFSMHGYFRVPEGYRLYVYVHEVFRHGAWYCGIPLASSHVIRVLPSDAGDAKFGAGTRVSIILFPHPGRDGLSRPVGVDPSQGRIEMPRVVAVDAIDPLKRHCDDLFDRLADMEGAAASATFEGQILDSMLEACFREGAVAGRRDPLALTCRHRHTHYLMFRRAVDFMHAHYQRDIYVEELADVVRVSVRNLRYAFESLVEISPNRYLSLLRLCEAYRRLSWAGAGLRSIKSVALGCGFWNFSHFAHSYRRMFDEYPSDTVARQNTSVIA